MKFRKVLTLMFLAMFSFSILCPIGNTDQYDFAYKGLDELPTLTETDSGDKLLVFDNSTKQGKTMDANDPTFGGDVTFQSTLISAGRKNGASTLSSSSTQLLPSTLPYVSIRKAIGSVGGLDETDGGTRLQNGTPGQILHIIIISRNTTGTWILTPDLTVGFTSLTFDAANEYVTMLYVNDTLGWMLISTNATIAQTGITGLD